MFTIVLDIIVFNSICENSLIGVLEVVNEDTIDDLMVKLENEIVKVKMNVSATDLDKLSSLLGKYFLSNLSSTECFTNSVVVVKEILGVSMQKLPVQAMLML